MKATVWIFSALLIAALAFATACDDGACATGETSCGGACVNVNSDANNCGTCGNACGTGQICSGGDCVCEGGIPPCGSVCCPSGQTCNGGSCTACSDREACNGLDDNCDGQIDENLTQPCNNACGAGTETCTNGSWTGCTAPTPGTEVCNGADDDCDGQTDEGVAVTLYQDSDNDTFGNVDATIQGCPGDEGYVENHDDCDDTDENINPNADEACNDGVDNNCDDAIDEGCTGCVLGNTQQCGEGGDTGECEWGSQQCADVGDGPVWGECEGGTRPVAETCDGLDNDCDGTEDDGLAGDTYENNDTCATARGPLEVEQDGDPLAINATLYKTDGHPDEDWFIILATENTDWYCGIPWIDNECAYYLAATLTPPSGELPEDWELCLYQREDDTCDGTVLFELCTDADHWNSDTGAYELNIRWEGVCGGNDDLQLFTVVRAAGSATAASCQEYGLSFEMIYVEEECTDA